MFHLYYWMINMVERTIYYTIMDFLLGKYGLIFTEFDSIDRGGAEVKTFKFSKYQTIFTELRGMGRHSWKCSRFKRTQMKIIHKYNLVHNFDFICFPYK